jgi:A/G-specific adenine glycosylase
LRRRPERGLLGGLMEFPSTAWRAEAWGTGEAIATAPFKGAWRLLSGSVRHGFTHFDLELTVLTARLRRGPAGAGIWARPDEFPRYALPTLMKKVAAHAGNATRLLESGGDRR